MSIKSQITFGIKLTSISLVIVRIARFITSIVLARLLFPEMFGLIAMANVAINIIAVIREVGFGAAFVQRKFQNIKDEDRAANTTFVLGSILNLVLFAICFLLAPFIAQFFQSNEVTSVIKILAISFLLESFVTVPMFILQKKLEFGKVAYSEIIRSICGAIIGITLAVSGFGVWSLVFSQLGSMIVFSGVLLYYSKWWPKIEFDWQISKGLFSYGKYLWAFSITSAIGAALDKAIIGRFWGAASLGFYDLAFNLSNMPTTLISSLINRITFPAYAKVQEDRLMLKSALLKTLSGVSIVTAPIAFGFLAVSHDFILTIYGQKWIAAAPLVNILAFYGLSLSISSITGSVFMAIGKPNVILYTSLLHHGIMVILLFLFRNYGVIGICYAVLIPMIVSSLIAFGLIIHYLKYAFYELTEPLLKSISSAFMMYLSIKMFQYFVLQRISSPIEIELLCSILLGIVSYVMFSFIINYSISREFIKLLKDVLISRGNIA